MPNQGTENPVASKTQGAELSALSKNQGPAKPGPSKKSAPMGKTEKQKACPHPYAEVVTLFDGTTICNHCYICLVFCWMQKRRKICFLIYGLCARSELASRLEAKQLLQAEQVGYVAC